jgi:hypothetical protein
VTVAECFSEWLYLVLEWYALGVKEVQKTPSNEAMGV